MPELAAIAHALDKDNFMQTMIATLHMRLPAFDEVQASRARKAEQLVKAGFNSAEPRDERGRWTRESGGFNVSPRSDNPRRLPRGGDDRNARTSLVTEERNSH